MIRITNEKKNLTFARKFNLCFITQFIWFLCNLIGVKHILNKMSINRLKIVLIEKEKTGKWLAQELGVDETTVSQWCTNARQPRLPTLLEIADVLDVDIKSLINSSKKA